MMCLVLCNGRYRFVKMDSEQGRIQGGGVPGGQDSPVWRPSNYRKIETDFVPVNCWYLSWKYLVTMVILH